MDKKFEPFATNETAIVPDKNTKIVIRKQALYKYQCEECPQVYKLQKYLEKHITRPHIKFQEVCCYR